MAMVSLLELAGTVVVAAPAETVVAAVVAMDDGIYSC